MGASAAGYPYPPPPGLRLLRLPALLMGARARRVRPGAPPNTLRLRRSLDDRRSTSGPSTDSWLNRRMEMKNALLIATVFLALAVGAQQTLAQERTVRFLCHAPTGHTCQYRVRTAAGPVDFALPSGERREVAGVTPLVDKYCVCDPGPVTPDCKAPQLGYWCLGHWSKVKRPPEMNSENDAIEGRFARE